MYLQAIEEMKAFSQLTGNKEEILFAFAMRAVSKGLKTRLSKEGRDTVSRTVLPFFMPKRKTKSKLFTGLTWPFRSVMEVCYD
jgi:hypothetical protein